MNPELLVLFGSLLKLGGDYLHKLAATQTNATTKAAEDTAGTVASTLGEVVTGSQIAGQ